MQNGAGFMLSLGMFLCRYQSYAFNVIEVNNFQRFKFQICFILVGFGAV